MTPKKEMWLVINESIEENSDRWYTSEDFADAVMEALEKAGFVPDLIRYRACNDATLQDEEGSWVDGVVSEEYSNRAEAEARLERLVYGHEAVSEDKYLERQMLSDWKRVR